jgi:glutamate racemase
VREYALAVLDDLVEQGVKLLVIACNTASSAMLRDARERYEVGRGIPVVEVIHPAVRAAVRQTRTKRIGVIGTAGTINSRAYDDAFIAASDLEIFSQACPRFVEFVESGVTSGAELFAVAEQYLAPLKAANIDTLVLGCTHYPLLAGAIQYVMGEDVTLVSSAEETAYDVYRMLVKHGLERTVPAPPRYRFEATGDSQTDFLRLASRFLGPEVRQVELVETGTIPIIERGTL